MPYDFHIGNRKSRIGISDPGIPIFRLGNYNASMVTRIGSKHPSRLYIKEWIKHRDLDQKRTAERMEIEPGTLSKLIAGKMEMTTTYLAGIADALDTSVPELFRDPATPTQAELLAMGTPEQLRAAMRLIQTMKTGTDG